MRKLLLPVLFIAAFATSCSSDDSAQSVVYNDELAPRTLCTPISGLNGLNLTANQAPLSSVEYNWGPALLSSLRTYQTKIEVKDVNCTGGSLTVAYPVNIHDNHATMAVPYYDKCFYYRMNVKGYSGTTLVCETTTDWTQYIP